MNGLLAIGLATALLAAAVSADAQSKMALPRRDCFFGLHFDLHPQKTDTSLGADITRENLDVLLDRVQPDFVQYDCKGHAGYTGYPTKIGWPSPGIVKDSLAIWREVTRERGIGLYIHYSGVWDSVAVEKHPEWARVDLEDKPDTNATSTFGAYVDELMIPQLKEVVEAYDLDGLWVDGECWAAQLDYGEKASAEWRRIANCEPPRTREDRLWQIWKNFNRTQFENYLSRWVDALHAFRPGLQITSNWMYSTFAPRAVLAQLDYLSGDYSPMFSVERARLEARYMASTGMPWDLMAWGFNSGDGLGSSLKTAVHLQQEAAVVLMQGGGFQIYYNPTRSGHISDAIIRNSAEVAGFCRARQAISHKSTSVPQVALLLSSETQADRSDAVFTPYGTTDEIEGALHALLESHYSVDVLAEHQLLPRLQEFPLVVVADSYKLADDFRSGLAHYVKNGGRLLLLGEKCARLFEQELGVEFEGEPVQAAAELEVQGGTVNENGVWQRVKPTTATAIARRFPNTDTTRGAEVAATVADLGKGRIAAVYGPVALNFFRSHHPALRSFIADLAQQMFDEPAVMVEGPPCVEISLRKTTDGRLSLHLMNRLSSQLSSRHSTADYIPTVGPIRVKLRVGQKPRGVSWVPDGGKLDWSWSSGTLTVDIRRLHIHGVLVLD